MKTFQQQQLNTACRAASGDGVGFQGAVAADGTVAIRRDEEYAPSTDLRFESLDEAVDFLKQAA